MPTRLRKVRRLRGSRTHGYGQIGQHRHSGKQGGHGNAGLHKHKWSWMIKYEPDHFGRDDFVPPGYPNVERWMNVGDLDGFELAARGKEEEKNNNNNDDDDDPIELDLTEMGVQKLLGSGNVGRAYNVKVPSFTKRAQSKVEEAGGKMIVG